MGVSKIRDMEAPKVKKFKGKWFWHVGTWSNRKYTELQAFKFKKFSNIHNYRILKVKNGMYRLYVNS
jgi:hypothetical protein